MAKGKRFTTELFKERLKEIYGGIDAFDKVTYTHHLTPTVITCPKHGEVVVTPKQLLFGSKNFYCPKCGTENRLRNGAISKLNNAKNSFVTKANKKHNNAYTYEKVDYVNSKTKVIITCPEHGDFEQTPACHLSGDGCRKCATDRQSKKAMKPFKNFAEQANEAHNNAYTYVESTYINSRELTEVVCKKHGTFWVTPDNHISKLSGCPKCVHQISSQEDKIVERFPQFERTNRKVISPYHLDLYSEDNKLAIEVNGRYWHSETNGKDSDYHLMKTEKCLEKGIRLLHFWDDEIDNKFPIVESMINSRFGASTRVYARTTEAIELVEVNDFLVINHLQGKSNHSVAYGLIYKGELISVMTFGKPRFSKDHEWEGIRFATKLNTTVVGGASKLFNAFVNAHKPNSIITYADRRYSEGGVYEKLGFTFSHNSKPSYFYFKNGVNVSRYNAQKHKLSKLLGTNFNEQLSESENMLANGFHKVYDCGNKVFIWKGSN